MRCSLRRWSPLLCLALCAAAAAAPSSPGADSKHEILAFDPARCLAEFEVRVMWLIGVHGRFGTLHGTIDIDRFHDTAKVDARIDVNDVHMRSSSNETWGKSDEFFDAEHYPQIEFVSGSFALPLLKTGGSIDGTLTIRGVHQQVRFELAASACPEAIARTCPTEAAGTIRRSDFGMRSRRGALSDKVQLSFSIFLLPVAEAVQ